MISSFIKMMEAGLIPDRLLRIGIRYMCKKRLEDLQSGSVEIDEQQHLDYINALRKLPLAVHTKDANSQHYELPADFFQYVLGSHLKYSSCYWSESTKDLNQAEENALLETIKRAEIIDGHRILELGCGWGSLTLKMAKLFPNSKIVAVSNSSSQKTFIDNEAKKRGLSNIIILTRDISELDSLALEYQSFDRVVSIEMFEHFKNYQLLLSKIAEVLSPLGKLFIHVFMHKKYAYPFETEGEDNWMGKYFFTGGQMPSYDLLMAFQDNLSLEKSWIWDGIHYEKTANHWLKNMDKNKGKIMNIFNSTYGEDSDIWFQRWRIFFMACAELFGYKKGQEWGVSHYLFTKK